MEENNTQQTTAQFQCTGDCILCQKAQRQYCASQHSYNTMRIVQKMQEAMEDIVVKVNELKTKIEAIQDNEALVFDPNLAEEPAADAAGTKTESTGPDKPVMPAGNAVGTVTIPAGNAAGTVTGNAAGTVAARPMVR